MPLIPLSPQGGPQTRAEITPVFQGRAIRAAVLASHGKIGLGATPMGAQHLAEIIGETARIGCLGDILMAANGRTAADLPRRGTAGRGVIRTGRRPPRACAGS